MVFKTNYETGRPTHTLLVNIHSKIKFKKLKTGKDGRAGALKHRREWYKKYSENGKKKRKNPGVQKKVICRRHTNRSIAIK